MQNMPARCFTVKDAFLGTGETAQQVRGLAALPEQCYKHWYSVPSTHLRQLTTAVTSVPEYPVAPCGLHGGMGGLRRWFSDSEN